MMSDVDPVAPDAWRGPPLASFASRAVALLIDALVLTLGGGAAFFAAFLIVLATVGGGSVESSGEAALLGIGVVSLVTVVAVVAASLYAPLLMARGGRHNGQTLGKHAVGIRVVHTRHPEIGFADAALREIVVKGVVIGLAGSFTFGLAVVLDLAWPLWDAQSRAGHDFLASTRVVDTVEAR